jgi:phosphoribosylformylglycinamidine cyclo-ligase
MNYLDAGVNVSLADALIGEISGFSDEIGKFAAHYNLAPWDGNNLVTSCDGVGTKVILAKYAKDTHGRSLHSIGQDCVAMVVNDMICEDAKPLFFLDYFATNKLNRSDYKEVLAGINDACASMKMKLIGGETAEMPGMFNGNIFDVCGFGVGVKRNTIRKPIEAGDRVIAIKSNGLHSNGFSVIRKIMENNFLDAESIDMLLNPTPLYYNDIETLRKNFVDIKAIANITGGGLNNIRRILPDEYFVRWKKNLPIYHAHADTFQWIQSMANITDADMQDTFNCGLGMVLVVSERPYIKMPLDDVIELGVVC